MWATRGRCHGRRHLPPKTCGEDSDLPGVTEGQVLSLPVCVKTPTVSQGT